MKHQRGSGKRTIAEKYNPYKAMTDNLVRMIEDGISPWQRPWNGAFAPAQPVNAIRKSNYNGINSFTLGMALVGKEDPRFATANQIEKAGWKLKPGAKGLPVYFFREISVSKKEEKTLGTVQDAEKGREPVPGTEETPGVSGSKAESVSEPRTRLVMWTYTVFHADDIDGIPPIERKPQEATSDFVRYEMADKVLSSLGLEGGIVHQGNKAFYRPSEDKIVLPPREDFKTHAGYYTVALHEAGHATGHESRLDRETIKLYHSDTKIRAKEELTAEMASIMMAQRTGIPMDEDHLKNQAAYLESWLGALKENPKFLYKASQDAAKAVSFMLGKAGLAPGAGSDLAAVSESSDDEEMIPLM